ncbi:MAG: L-carnitine dehydrogenase [Alphaproteobacteria bacterium MarineAlpha3_Bin5]|nr:carnitine 3-dehydrogenase [Magnetovibrio sp.]PPR77685.1 MAG: L-carnitine dehydrogenase [Alphaproteobacteria bacterium MarineAlpha3_Bin5]
MKVGVVGGGVIGAGWAARFLLNGWDVSVFDPNPNMETTVLRTLTNARRCLPSLYDKTLPVEGKLYISNSVSEAVENAVWIQESVPERLDLKKTVFSHIQNFALRTAIIASSTSGFKPSQLQEGAQFPEQILVCHPFNPVYLLPLVEIVKSDISSSSVVTRAIDILEQIGMKPLLLRKEIDGHIADRLIEALWREALWLIHDDVATTEEVDDAMKFAMGIRYALMGIFEHYRLAGGEDGMRHALEQFGPCLHWPWTKLVDVPDLTYSFIEKIAQQSDIQSKGLTIQDLERSRDDTIVGIIRAMKKTSRGAGATVKNHEEKLKLKTLSSSGLIQTVERQVPSAWIDCNGHMNEAHYLETFSQATDAFMELIGVDADYLVKKDGSYFTVETHIRHLDEVTEGEIIAVETQVLAGEGKRMHLFHFLKGTDDRLVATGEHMLIHVSLKTRASSLPGLEVLEKLSYYLNLQVSCKYPEGAGKVIYNSL